MKTFPAIAIVVAAKIRSAEEEKKAAAAAPATLPPVGLLPPMLQSPSYQVGTAVRDILSGMTGIIVEPLEGNFGDLIFMKCDADNQTYPIRSDQIERVESQPAPPMPMAAPAPAPVPAAAAPEKAAGEKPVPGPKASKLDPMAIVSSAADPRKITFASILEKVGKKPITASALIQSFGYVPDSFDRLIAALAESGITVLRSGARPDIRRMLAKGMNSREIIHAACSAAGPVRDETIRRISACRAGLKLASRLRAAIAENRAKVAASRVAAEIPTKPKPTSVLMPGLIYAWNTQTKDWDVIELKAAFAKFAAARTAPADKKLHKDIEQAWYRLASGVQVDIMDIGKIFSESEAAVKAGKTVDEAVAEARDKYRKN